MWAKWAECGPNAGHARAAGGAIAALARQGAACLGQGKMPELPGKMPECPNVSISSHHFLKLAVFSR